MPEDFTNQIEIHYVDGKPVRKNKDPQKEIKKELNSEEPENMFDDTKRQLYANTPKAELKKDKSITARQLNQTLESYNSIKFRGESANIDVKNPGVLEVPDGKKVDELPQSHFEKLVDKKGYAEVIRALTNLEVWNKDKNKSLSSWASNMADKLKKKFRPESSQKNEDGTSWFVTLELRAPSSMNNRAVEDKLEKVIEQNGITVLDVTAERK